MPLPDDFVPGQVIAAADMNAIKDEVALKLDTTTATATFAAKNAPSVVTADGEHNAFPGAVRADDDAIVITYRKGATHLTGVGTVARRRSTDNGLSWGAEATAFAPMVEGRDLRDPILSRLADGTILCSAFEYNGTIGTAVRFSVSTDDGVTFSPAANITTDFAYEAAVCAPIVELSAGTWVLPIYGRASGASPWYARLAKTTDSGATWTTTLLAQNASIDFTEPNIIKLASGRLLCLVRTEQTPHTIYSLYSDDSGVTWSTPVAAFPGYGAPRLWQRNSGVIDVAYRSDATDKAGRRTSYDNGLTWGPEVTFDAAALRFVYGAWVDGGEELPGLVWAEEENIVDATYSNIYFAPNPAGGAGRGSGVAVDRVTLTTGNIEWTALVNTPAVFTSAVDVAVPAKPGDWCEYVVNMMLEPSSATGEIRFDAAVIVSGAVVRYLSSGTATKRSLSGLYAGGGTTRVETKSHNEAFRVTSADISGGRVLIRMYYRSSVAITQTKRVYASADYPLNVSLRNLGQ